MKTMQRPVKTNHLSATGSHSRAIYNKIVADLHAKHGAGHGFLVSPSYLRIETVLKNNKSKYLFEFKKTGNEAATEVKLDRNDLFFITHIGFFLCVQDTTKVGAEVLQTYPNNTYFTAFSGVTPSDLNAVYNGFTSLKIANRVNIENLSMAEFLKVPRTQQSSATNRDNFTLEERTYKPAAIISLHGTMDIAWSVEFPTYTGIAIEPTATTTLTKLILIPYGFLVKGGADRK